MEISTPDELEQHPAAVAVALTAPGPAECVLCYVERMLTGFGFGCDGHCDCEVFLNGWTLREDLHVQDEDGTLARPAEHPPCAGVGPRSARHCGNGRPWRRDRW